MLLFKSKEAHSHIKGGRQYPSIDGTVDFKETKDGVLLTARIHGLPKSPNKCKGRFFGFHIHEGSSCTGSKEDEFANVSLHYNPTKCPHPFHVVFLGTPSKNILI